MAQQTLRTGQVFVPGQAPLFTYNPRAARNLEELLRTYLDDGGAILTLVGPTKTGKTVLLENVLTDPVWLEGQGLTDVDTFWTRIGSDLAAYNDESRQDGESEAIETGGTLGVPGFAEANARLTNGTTSGRTQSAIRATGPVVRRKLEASGRVLVIDDFHFIDRVVQQEIIRAVKPLVFSGVRVIFAAISHRVHDVPEAVEDMTQRADPLVIELWSVDELKYIAREGFRTLNVVDHGEELATVLAENSFGSPHLMQKLCRELVRQTNGVYETAPVAVDLAAPSDWNEFFTKQIDSYSGKWYTKLFNGPAQRGNKRDVFRLKDGRQVDGYGLILVAVASLAPSMTITRQELNAAITDLVENEQPPANRLTGFLQHMTRIAAKKLTEPQIDEETLDAEDAGAEGSFFGVDPALEYVEDGSASTLNIADPFFAFYARWGGHLHISAAPERA